MNAAPETLLDYTAAAEALTTSVRTVRRLVARKLLKCVRLGHRTARFRPADLDRAKALLAGEAPREW